MNATIAIFIAAFSFSFYPLLNTIAMETTSNFLLAMIVQIVTPIFSFVVLVFHLKSVSKSFNLFKIYFKLPWDIQIIPILSGTGIFLGALFFLFALEMMSKAGATLIMECWPLMAILVARSLLTHKEWDAFKPLDGLLIIITLIGLAFISASEANLSLEEFITSPQNLFAGQSLEGLAGIILAILAALCFAWGGVSRSYFVTKLPNEMRVNYFGKKESLAEANFTYMMTYIFGVPSAIFCFFMFESSNPEFSTDAILPIIMIAISLIITSAFYAFGLLIARNANINLLWYIAPVLATLWLVIFGYSVMTPLLVLGGFLIILANFILIFANKKEAKGAHI
jgi:drug/metabolite transporter (DMT)-like permease